MLNLSPQQSQAFDLIMAWMKDPTSKRFVLSGYAGTGKTTLARHIEDSIDGIVFVAYTGKAANVLREKGCKNAGTIHSLLYKAQKTHDGEIEFIYCPSIGYPRLVICDEYSMVNMELIKDLERSVPKVLYLGDDFQLPPVSGGNCLRPDFKLTEVHRQALDSNIIRIATDLRNMIEPTYCDHPDFTFCRKRELDRSVFMGVDQILCGTNRTRIEWTRKYRGEGLPVKGDRVMCLKNDSEQELFNGMTAIVQENMRPGHISEIVMDIGTYKCATSAFWDTELIDKGYPKKTTFWRYACVNSVHKSQGSEWDTGLIYDEPIGATNLDKMRWRYTAVSRFKKKVWLCN